MIAARLSVPVRLGGQSFGPMAPTLAPLSARSFGSRDAMVVLNVAHA
jgi:hypothetical protein